MASPSAPALLWVERRQWFPVLHERTVMLGDLRQPGRGERGPVAGGVVGYLENGYIVKKFGKI